MVLIITNKETIQYPEAQHAVQFFMRAAPQRKSFTGVLRFEYIHNNKKRKVIILDEYL